MFPNHAYNINKDDTGGTHLDLECAFKAAGHEPAKGGNEGPEEGQNQCVELARVRRDVLNPKEPKLRQCHIVSYSHNEIAAHKLVSQHNWKSSRNTRGGTLP